MRVFNVYDAEMTYDTADPPQYAAGAHRFGPEVGGSRMGATVYELPPGTAICPYHYESEEEWLLVLAGELTVRHPEGEDVLRAGDVTAFPTGPAGAHKTTNNGTETVAADDVGQQRPDRLRRLPGLGQDRVLVGFQRQARQGPRAARGGAGVLRRRGMSRFSSTRIEQLVR
jgi:uncharacterized cupin superfamily protein